MKPKKAPPENRSPKAHSDLESVRLLWLAMFVSVFSFLFYYRNGEMLLYGDAVAHINIARRIFDSRTPGLLQLGTVWLPLPHLLILPFVVSKQMWQSGSGGSIPSMAAFVIGVLGIFRLARTALSRDGKVDGVTRVGSWAAAILFVANPNLIYMQSTAMGEPLYLAFFIWAITFFAEFLRGNGKALVRCGWCLMGACLTRYDGWFLAVLMVLAGAVVGLQARDETSNDGSKAPIVALRSAMVKFVLLAAAAPVLWLAYNAAVYQNPLEFANGPYSAKAIERNTATVNPAKGSLFAAGSYFLKAAELNVANSNWAGRTWVALALIGILASWLEARARAALLLWLPLPFYAISIAYGSVPIFVPTWWPFSVYNVRYGLELLPGFAVFVPLGISFLIRFLGRIPAAQLWVSRWADIAAFATVLLLATSSYAAVWREDPICYREAQINMQGRVAIDKQLGDWIKSLPPDSTFLMYLGDHVGALERAGIPLKRTINEGNHRVWKQPFDSQGLWERALADPAAYANYAVGFQGDPVWKAAEARHLPALVEIHTTGQPPMVLFQGGTKSMR
jgi:hypothetical protein